jgi:uncharacterized protein YbaP (TraB family)
MMIRALALAFATIYALAAHADPAAWHVTRPGGGGELWLLGSVHYLRDEDYPLPAVVDELYARAEIVVMELDLDVLDPLLSQSRFLAAAMLPAGQKLPDVLSDEVYARAKAQADALGIDLALLERFEPWLVAVTMLDLGMSRLGYRADRGLEQYLLQKARADRKEILGLETLETQIAVFDGLSDVEQQAMLEQTLEELNEAAEAMSQMIAAWRAGELDDLADVLMQEFAAFPSLYTTLVVNRNADWVESLEGFLADPRPHLVVVGALHLVGEHSVIKSLAARGLQVRAVR